MQSQMQEIINRLKAVESDNARIKKLINICVDQEKLKRKNEILKMENRKIIKQSDSIVI